MNIINQERIFMYNTNIFNDDEFWGDGGLDEANDFNDDMLLSETSYVGPDYIDSSDVKNEFIMKE